MQKRQVSWVKSWIAPFSKISQSYTIQPFCEYIALFLWVERAACSETLSRDKGWNRGTCASDGCFTKRVGRSMTEQQNTWCFLNSKVSGRQSRILARLLEFNFQQRLPQCNSLDLYQLPYVSWTPLYGHPLNTETLLIIIDSFPCPWVKTSHFL